MVLGGETTKTVASDISNLNLFKDVPEIYMYGMLCSVTVAGTWLLLATYWCLPVSTTHSISELHTSRSHVLIKAYIPRMFFLHLT